MRDICPGCCQEERFWRGWRGGAGEGRGRKWWRWQWQWWCRLWWWNKRGKAGKVKKVFWDNYCQYAATGRLTTELGSLFWLPLQEQKWSWTRLISKHLLFLSLLESAAGPAVHILGQWLKVLWILFSSIPSNLLCFRQLKILDINRTYYQKRTIDASGKVDDPDYNTIILTMQNQQYLVWMFFVKLPC